MAKQSMDWISPIGGNWAYMIQNRQLIGEFIRINELKPVTIGAMSTRAAPTASALLDLGIRGGIRVPHLHFSSKIYMLNDAQWAKFSGGIIADCKAKLAKVKEVSFEEGMLLGNVAQTFTKG
jgi:hypothetical protein